MSACMNDETDTLQHRNTDHKLCANRVVKNVAILLRCDSIYVIVIYWKMVSLFFSWAEQDDAKTVGHGQLYHRQSGTRSSDLSIGRTVFSHGETLPERGLRSCTKWKERHKTTPAYFRRNLSRSNQRRLLNQTIPGPCRRKGK